MSNEQQGQEVTPEQYKARLLKQNFANRCAEYEDMIATLQTQLAMAQQQVEQQESDDTDVSAPSQKLPPPPPIEE